MAEHAFEWSGEWTNFKQNLPHQNIPYSKKNWGNARHSLCSYQGKLKPAIAYHLIKTFVPNEGTMFDPFAGVGTIPFEAVLNNRIAYGMDISIMAYYIAQAKVGLSSYDLSCDYINLMDDYIRNNTVAQKDYDKYSTFGLNKKLADYYEINTFKEILSARKFIQETPPSNSSEMVVISSLLHILHGNRPYALSRKSHPITPYAPTGEFVYKNIIEKLREKINRFYNEKNIIPLKSGQIFFQDSTTKWPKQISGLDAIITSPPFFDSTRFYNANWIRLWFCGWEPEDFKTKPQLYIDERQKQNFDVYIPILKQAKERLKSGGVFVFHLGKSCKCNMGEILQREGLKWFKHSELFVENVEHCDTFGISDIGTVTDHQYLVLY